MRSLDRYEIIGSVIAVIGAGIYFMAPHVDTKVSIKQTNNFDI
jgi:hypothetical protein